MSTKLPVITDPVANLPAIEGFPASQKVFIEQAGLRVPVRRIALVRRRAAVRRLRHVAGRRGIDPHHGLPKLRAAVDRGAG